MKFFLMYTWVCLLGCASSGNDFKIIPLSPFCNENRFNSVVHKECYYLVEGYKGKKEQDLEIEEFAFAHRENNSKNLDNFRITFYKTSKRTNRKYRETPSDIIDWHSDDIIFDFSWSHGKYIGLFKYKNGTIQSNEIQVTGLDSNYKKKSK